MGVPKKGLWFLGNNLDYVMLKGWIIIMKQTLKLRFKRETLLGLLYDPIEIETS